MKIEPGLSSFLLVKAYCKKNIFGVLKPGNFYGKLLRYVDGPLSGHKSATNVWLRRKI